MKIAYVALHLEEKFILGGVGHKIQSHRRIWQEMGHEAQIFLLSPDRIKLPEVNCFRYSATPSCPPLRLIQREIARSRALARLLGAVREYQPDVIYLRYGLYAYPLQRLFKIAPVVVEINTDDICEYRHRGMFFYLYNRLTRGELFRRAAGLVAISHEIAELPENTKWHKPITIISNGIDLNEFGPLPAQAKGNPSLVMVATPGLPWQGVEKLSFLAIQYSKLVIHIIGLSMEDWGNLTLPSNIILHGWLERKNIEKILRQCDVACGTLALHEKNMREASPLKVREALAYGMPIILAYDDTDLINHQSDYILRIPNTSDNLVTYASQIYGFASNMRGQRIPRSNTDHLIDQRTKERKRIKFFFSIRDQTQ